ncbi:MAG: hypothetical protein LBT79_02355 [Elusimicrobiota bacterium]|jgi:hypothetical protein|nr:hypothetical protein [Elusimicrobiota bacterium]
MSKKSGREIELFNLKKFSVVWGECDEKEEDRVLKFGYESQGIETVPVFLIIPVLLATIDCYNKKPNSVDIKDIPKIDIEETLKALKEYLQKTK